MVVFLIVQYELMSMYNMEWEILFMNLYLYRLSVICKGGKFMVKTSCSVFHSCGRLVVSSFRLEVQGIDRSPLHAMQGPIG